MDRISQPAAVAGMGDFKEASHSLGLPASLDRATLAAIPESPTSVMISWSQETMSSSGEPEKSGTVASASLKVNPCAAVSGVEEGGGAEDVEARDELEEVGMGGVPPSREARRWSRGSTFGGMGSTRSMMRWRTPMGIPSSAHSE